MAIELIILLAAGGIAAVAAILHWRRRQHRRLLNSRETAHLLRQAQYLQQLAQTVLYCRIDARIARVLLRLAEETLMNVATAGQPDACDAIASIRNLGLSIESALDPAREDQPPAVVGDDLAEYLAQMIEKPLARPRSAIGEPDYARIRLHLTDATRLLHRAYRKGFIDRGQHDEMTRNIQKARLLADVKHMLLRATEARGSGDLARARACLSQARARLDEQDAAADIRRLVVDIDQRLIELGRVVPDPDRHRRTSQSAPQRSATDHKAAARAGDG